MGDVRFEEHLARLRDATDRIRELRRLEDEEVIAALAATAAEHEPYLTNVLATEALNRARRTAVLRELIADGILIADEETRITWANPAAEKLLQRSLEEMRDRTLDELGHHDEEGLCPMERALTMDVTLCDESTYLDANGNRMAVSMTVSPIRDRDGRTTGVVATMRDITSRLEAERELRLRDARLVRQNETLVHLARRVGRLPLAKFLTALTWHATRALSTDRTTVWMFDRDGERLRCMDLHDRRGIKELPEALRSDEHPVYFEALEHALILAVSDTTEDPRTESLAEYVDLVDVRALLDAPIRIGGRVAGVVCHESQTVRQWSADEEHFAGSIASLAALAIEAHRRKKAQVALHETLILRNAVLDAASRAKVGIVFTVDTDDTGRRVAYANKSAAELLGVAMDDFLTSDPLTFVNSEDLHRLEEWESKRRRGEAVPSEFRLRVVRGDGTQGRLEVGIGQAAYQGRPGTVCIFRDVTEKVEADKALRERAIWLRNVVSGLPVILFALDAEGIVTLSEGGALGSMGLAPGDLVGRSVFEDEWGDPIVRETAARALSGETVRREERTDAYVFDTRWGPLKDESGQITGAAGAAIDITERDRAKRYARSSLAWLQTVVANAPVAMFALDMDGRFTLSAGAGLRRLGLKSGEAVGKSIFEMYADEPDLLEDARRALKGESFESTRKIAGVTFDKHWTPLRDPEGRLIGTAGVAVDVTELTRAYADLTAQRARLETLVDARTRTLQETNRDLEAFTYSVSHDLKAPLRGITNLAEAALEDLAERLDGDDRELVARIQREAERARDLVDDLLVLSRVSREEPRIMDIDLSRIARDVVAELRRSDPERNVDVHIEQGLETRGDEGLVRVALQNLIGNAWKFTRETVEPRISFTRRGEAYCVQDNGPGFDPAETSRLFEPFERLGTAANFEGTGIGLATVRRIIERHGGRVWAEGRPGEGATFCFTLGS